MAKQMAASHLAPCYYPPPRPPDLQGELRTAKQTAARLIKQNAAAYVPAARDDFEEVPPNAPGSFPRTAYDESMGPDAAAREVDVARRALEKAKTQLRTGQGEKSKLERELRTVKSKFDSHKGSLENSERATREKEAELMVQQAATEAVMLRLQLRTAECSALQQQLSVRAVELMRRRDEVAIARVTIDLLQAELPQLERWGEMQFARANYHQASQQRARDRLQAPWAIGSSRLPTRATSPPPPGGRGAVDGVRSPERSRPPSGGSGATAGTSAEARARPARTRSPAPR